VFAFIHGEEPVITGLLKTSKCPYVPSCGLSGRWDPVLFSWVGRSMLTKASECLERSVLQSPRGRNNLNWICLHSLAIKTKRFLSTHYGSPLSPHFWNIMGGSLLLSWNDEMMTRGDVATTQCCSAEIVFRETTSKPNHGVYWTPVMCYHSAYCGNKVCKVLYLYIIYWLYMYACCMHVCNRSAAVRSTWKGLRVQYERCR
jgi:hypothetical protein